MRSPVSTNRLWREWAIWRFCKWKERKPPTQFTDPSNFSYFSPCSTLNNNNLTALPRDLFAGLRLRALRLSDNPFGCDCHLSWLSRYLRTASRLAPNTKCHSPSQLKGQNVADLHDQDFKCSGKWSREKWQKGRATKLCWHSSVNCKPLFSIRCVIVECRPEQGSKVQC